MAWLRLAVLIFIAVVASSAVPSKEDKTTSKDDDDRAIRVVIYRKTQLLRKRKACAHCPPGWGVVSLCNDTEPTVCQPCPDGTWSPKTPHLSKCTSCSLCGDGLYVEYKCTNTSDTRCNWCAAQRGVFNDDFKRKCSEYKSSSSSEVDTKAQSKIDEEVDRNTKNHGIPDDGNAEHEFWHFPSDDDDDDDDDTKEMADEKDADEEEEEEEDEVWNPSSVDYKPTLRSSARVDQIRAAIQRQKAYILLAMSVGLLLVSVLFIVWFCRQCCVSSRSRVIPKDSRLYVYLAETHDDIIKKCASQARSNGRSQPVGIDVEDGKDDEYWEEPMTITENPFEQSYPAFGSTEQLIANSKHPSC